LEEQAQDVPAASSDPLFSTFGKKIFGIGGLRDLKVTHFDPLIHLPVAQTASHTLHSGRVAW
jgi:hypothetical protein